MAENGKHEFFVKGSGAVWNEVHDASYIAQLLQARDVYGNIYFGDVKHLEPSRYPEEYLDYLASVHVVESESEFERASRGISKRRYGYIVGNPGSGREITAVTLLVRNGFSVRYLLLEAEELGQLSRIPHQSGLGYIIDLSSLGESFDDAKRKIMNFWIQAKSMGCVVLVVLRPGQRSKEGFQSSPLVMQPVSGVRVFASHLEHLTGESASAWVSRRDVVEVLDSATPESAVRLARISAECHPRFEADLDAWVSSSLAAHGRWGQEIENWFDGHRGEGGVWSRIVLISCAMFEGLDAVTVLSSADRMAEDLGRSCGDAGGLAGSGVAAALRMVGATCSADGAVGFDGYQYGSAVLDYVWVQHPRMRKELLEWSTRQRTEISTEQAEELAARWAKLLIRNGSEEWDVRAFRFWMEKSGTLSMAVAFAAHVASAPTFGKRMRARLYTIAKNPVIPMQAKAVALVCERLGRVNITSALVRLRHLAGAEDGSVRAQVENSLVALAGVDSAWYPLVLEVVGWIGGSDDNRENVACGFVVRELNSLEENGSLRLLNRAESSVEADRVGVAIAWMWSALLDTSNEELVARAAEKWIPLAVRRCAQGEVFRELLKSAIQGGTRSTRAEITRRTVTANRAVSLWCAENAELAEEHQAAILTLHDMIHLAGQGRGLAE
ncbi:hypothetical protein [Nocardiopsis sp. B62]|uniref:hypothetical protein n=1 Tax=Nocardiopsis sp. B62 TaxID=2824874 RepID=UPI001B363636|nr:hypothetical protein [Nocardiopsis sp. B62]